MSNKKLRLIVPKVIDSLTQNVDVEATTEMNKRALIIGKITKDVPTKQVLTYLDRTYVVKTDNAAKTVIQKKATGDFYGHVTPLRWQPATPEDYTYADEATMLSSLHVNADVGKIAWCAAEKHWWKLKGFASTAPDVARVANWEREYMLYDASPRVRISINARTGSCTFTQATLSAQQKFSRVHSWRSNDPSLLGDIKSPGHPGNVCCVSNLYTPKELIEAWKNVPETSPLFGPFPRDKFDVHDLVIVHDNSPYPSTYSWDRPFGNQPYRMAFSEYICDGWAPALTGNRIGSLNKIYFDNGPIYPTTNLGFPTSLGIFKKQTSPTTIVHVVWCLYGDVGIGGTTSGYVFGRCRELITGDQVADGLFVMESFRFAVVGANAPINGQYLVWDGLTTEAVPTGNNQTVDVNTPTGPWHGVSSHPNGQKMVGMFGTSGRATQFFMELDVTNPLDPGALYAATYYQAVLTGGVSNYVSYDTWRLCRLCCGYSRSGELVFFNLYEYAQGPAYQGATSGGWSFRWGDIEYVTSDDPTLYPLSGHNPGILFFDFAKEVICFYVHKREGPLHYRKFYVFLKHALVWTYDLLIASDDTSVIGNNLPLLAYDPNIGTVDYYGTLPMAISCCGGIGSFAVNTDGSAILFSILHDIDQTSSTYAYGGLTRHGGYLVKTIYATASGFVDLTASTDPPNSLINSITFIDTGL